MYWRIGAAYRQQSAEANQEAFRQIVFQGPPPGLLAFHADLAVGWCQLSPRADLPWLARPVVLRPVDEKPVWCISCFYVRKGWRRKGVTAALTIQAIDLARNAGVPALEAYPLDRKHTPSSSSTGFATTFRKLGFQVVARRVKPRPIMRYTFP